LNVKNCLGIQGVASTAKLNLINPSFYFMLLPEF